MQEVKIQYVLDRLNKELHRFIDAIGDIPYVALPLERPEIICFSAKIKKLTGYDVNEILTDREHWENMIHPDDQERVFAVFARCKNRGIPFNIGYRIIHKNDSVRYVNDKGEPVFDNKGEITQIEGTITPLREIMKAENIPSPEFEKATMFNNVNSNCFQKV
jgi:PAS domain S-box-containing protein